MGSKFYSSSEGRKVHKYKIGVSLLCAEVKIKMMAILEPELFVGIDSVFQ